MNESPTVKITVDPDEIDRLRKKVEGGEDLTLTEFRSLMPARINDEGQLEIQLSDRAFAIVRRLNGQESMKCDALIGDSTNADLKFKTYALYGLTKLIIDGKEKMLAPVDRAGMNVGVRGTLMDALEAKSLGEAFAMFFMTPMEASALKNA